MEQSVTSPGHLNIVPWVIIVIIPMIAMIVMMAKCELSSPTSKPTSSSVTSPGHLNIVPWVMEHQLHTDIWGHLAIVWSFNFWNSTPQVPYMIFVIFFHDIFLGLAWLHTKCTIGLPNLTFSRPLKWKFLPLKLTILAGNQKNSPHACGAYDKYRVWPMLTIL